MPKIIDHKHWYNRETARTASVYGSVPWTNHIEAEAWTMVTAGYSIQWDDGTIGCGRPPFVTYEEAESFLARNANFPGMSQD